MSDQVSAAALMSSLTMPLTELRERVDLVERLAIASRHAVISGAAPAAPATTSAGAGKEAQGAAGGKAPDPAAVAAAAAKKKADAAAAAAAKKKADDAAAAAAASGGDADLDAAFGDGAASSGEGDDFSAELGDGGDMLAGFVPDMTPEEAKAAAVKIAGQVIQKKDAAELTTARGIMSKFGVSKVSDVAAGREVELYTAFREGYPHYAD